MSYDKKGISLMAMRKKQQLHTDTSSFIHIFSMNYDCQDGYKYLKKKLKRWEKIKKYLPVLGATTIIK